MSVAFAHALSAVILLTMLGLAAGNYATSIIYRLPRGLKIPNDPPYCDSCRQYLAVRDLFPFFSWVVNRGKCRFCGVKIPAMYAVVEWASVMVFNIAYFRLGLGEPMVLVIALGMFAIIMAAHYFENQRYYNEILIAVVAIAALHRVLLDATIYGFVKGAYLGLLMALVGYGVACLQAKKKVRFPHSCLMPIIAGIALASPAIFLYPIYALPLYAAMKAKGGDYAASAGVVSGCVAMVILLFI